MSTARLSTVPGDARSAALRLTRRGRIVVTLLLVALFLVALTWAGDQSAASDGPAGTDPGQPTRTVVVSKGDTLWAIAGEAAPGRDIREVMHEIRVMNALPGPELAEGQELVVPAG